MSSSNADESRQPKANSGWVSRERALVVTLALATALAFYVCYRLAYPFLPALAWALALAVVAHPFHEWIERRLRHPNLAAGLAVIVVAVVLIAPAVFVVRHMAEEAATRAETIKTEIDKGTWRARIEGDSRIASVVKFVERQVNLKREIQELSSKVGDRLSSLVSGSIWALAQLFITLFALFFFFRDRRAVLRALRSLVPLSDSETDEVFARVSDTVYATVYGTLTVAMVQGALGGLMFWWLGLPGPVLWGTVMAIVATVPVLGAFIVWLPAAGYFALSGSWGKAVILTAWGTIVIGLIDNLLYPVLVGNKLRLHTLPIFIALVGGIALFGTSGLILGPLALVLTLALVDVWRRRTAGGQTAETVQLHRHENPKRSKQSERI